MAARDSLQAAGLEEYEYIATAGPRTCGTCSNLNGTVYLLSEFEVGTNAPPMHPRCRCTISAVVGKAKVGKINGTEKPTADLTPLQQKIKSAEDKAFVATTGEDFGFKKLNRAPNWATEISYVNGDGKGLERAINCQRCAVAIEARIAKSIRLFAFRNKKM